MNQRLHEIDQAIETLTAAQARRKQLTAQMDELYRQRCERQARVEETARIFRKEQDEVDLLEKGGLRSLLLSLTGGKKGRLDKERLEALAAKCQYDQARSDLDYLENKLNDLIRERNELVCSPQKLEQLRAEKVELVTAMGGQRGARLAQVEEQLRELNRQRKELQEAISAGMTVKRLLSQIQDDLDGARSYGTWDMLGGGVIATAAKHDWLDSAQSTIRAAQRALCDFRTELADVSDLQIPNIQIGSFATFMDYFFDGIFSDWFVQSGIKKAQDRVSEVYVNLTAVLRTLHTAAEELDKRLAPLKAERDELLNI